MSEDLAAFVSNGLKNAGLWASRPQDIRITKLFGQASSRQYFRAFLAAPGNTEPHTYVVMKLPGGATSLAEEITKGPQSQELPFLNIQRYLERIGVPVPAVHFVSPKQDLVLLEDLGDQTLEKLVANAGGEFKIFYYRKVLDALVDFQMRTAANPDPACIACNRTFDAELLNWEFDHFWQYGIADRLKTEAAAAGKDLPEPFWSGYFPNTTGENPWELFARHTREITGLIVKMPQGFVHRDFQSRNILFRDYEFHYIDFQDALQGPLVYDLVALLRDSYIAFTPEESARLLAYFSQALPAGHPYAGDEARLTRDFHLVTLQRKLKDAGRFQYIHTVKGNPNFLVHVPQTLAYVKQAFAALPEFSWLHQVIATFNEELR